ncbi:CobW family GTP-binding protein [Ilumatobacter sp.]|uniref:CobW family GTP-binding protein n=1 Tax=Ilumatobacter sp. TaxID=1967498 RepID=UPI003C3C5AE3
MGSLGEPTPITVIGGYLGGGKTTLVNSVIHRAAGRRLGIVVNDFGDLAVDAGLLHSADRVVNLANGCVCCTLGDDLRSTLEELSAIEPPLDHIVIEASGVADPTTAAAWGTVPGFAPGGILVVAAADSVMRSARDRYVGGEVRRQLVGADLVVVTKDDLCDPAETERVVTWIGTQTDAPTVRTQHGEIALDLVLGPGTRPSGSDVQRSRDAPHDLDGGEYITWSAFTEVVAADDLDGFLSNLPDGVLRMKGVVDVRGRSGAVSARLVQVVGRTVAITDVAGSGERGLEAIGVAGVLDPVSLQSRAKEYLRA